MTDSVSHPFPPNLQDTTSVSRVTADSHEKSHIRETPTLSTDADSRVNTNLKRLRDLSFFKPPLPPPPLWAI